MATMLPMVAALLVLPQGRLVGVVSPEKLANIFLVVFTPMILIFAAMMLRWGFEAYQDMKQRWASGTRVEKVYIRRCGSLRSSRVGVHGGRRARRLGRIALDEQHVGP